MTDTESPTIAFVGGGQMARALLGGLIQRGHPRQRLRASARTAATCEQVNAEWGVTCVIDNRMAVADARLVVLCVKPAQILPVLAEIEPALAADALVLSVAAGVPLAALRAAAGGRPVVRAMPNTPAAIGLGATGLAGDVNDAERALADAVLGAAGQVFWVDDDAALDAVTAISGSGPAYFFYMIEALTRAGEQLGLAPELAAGLAVATARGAGALAAASDVSPAELRRRVTSPGGTTERGIAALAEAGFDTAVITAAEAARARAAELAQTYLPAKED